MTHYIFETMVFERHFPHGGYDIIVRQECVGHRMSGDGGKSWIVAGNVKVQKMDSFESRLRTLSMEEYCFRIARGFQHVLTITTPHKVSA